MMKRKGTVRLMFEGYSYYIENRWPTFWMYDRDYGYRLFFKECEQGFTYESFIYQRLHKDRKKC